MGIKSIIFAVICSLFSITASAKLVDISWIGSDGYSMGGTFSYDDMLINTGIINETQINTLFIEAFQNNVSVATWDMADGSTASMAFNFNFDTTALEFIIGGASDLASGQQWNVLGSGIGFISGSSAQFLTINGALVSSSLIQIADSTLSTAKLSAVPLPAAVWLFGSGLIGMAGYARRKM